MRTTTDAKNWKFQFTVTDLARFLGKSPVTLRHWERQGLVVFPRDNNGDRRLTSREIRQMARIAKTLGRITEQRLNLVEAAVTMLEMVEQANNAENRTYRRTNIGKVPVGTGASNGTSPT